jgi:hypothetical protein
MESYDYMKSLLPVPNHSVSLHAMSGGGVNNNRTVPKEGNTFFNSFDVGLDKISESKENTNSKENDESKDNNDQNDMNITLPKKGNTFFNAFNIGLSSEKIEPKPVRDFNIGGEKYYLYDVSNASQIDLSNVNILTFINDFHLNLLEPDQQREFIFALLKCENMNSIIQGITCDPLITQIGILIDKINESYSNVLKNKLNVIDNAEMNKNNNKNNSNKSMPDSKKDIDVIDKIAYDKHNVKDDGWCLYRAIIRAYALIKDPSANDIKDWYEYENNKIKEIMPDLINNMQQSLDDKYIITINKNINSTLRDYIDEYIKYKPEEVNNVNTVDEYINALNVYKDNEFNNGPLIWGDALISGYIYSKMKKIILNTYQDCSGASEIPDCENKYKLYASSKEYIDKSITDHIDIWYNGHNHYNLLVKKSNTNSKESGGKRFLKARLHK